MMTAGTGSPSFISIRRRIRYEYKARNITNDEKATEDSNK